MCISERSRDKHGTPRYRVLVPVTRAPGLVLVSVLVAMGKRHGLCMDEQWIAIDCLTYQPSLVYPTVK